jgi:cytoskeleton protein RodZ
VKSGFAEKPLMASFGAQLKREREQRKISLDDISVSTKIGTRFLRAIEDDQFDQLPGGIFNKGFIRAYARHLGLDEERTVADYLEASGAEISDTKAAESPAVLPVTPEEPTAARIPWGSFAIVLLLAALTFATLKYYSREKPQGNGPAIENSQPQSSPLTAAQPAQPKASVQPPAPLAQPLAATPEKSQPLSGTFVVLLKARDDSWISGTIDGTQLPDQLLAASSEKSVSAQQSVMLKAGNIGALDIYFNGQKIPSQGEQGEVKTLAFDAHGLHPPSKP